jgi:hypothetical protein
VIRLCADDPDEPSKSPILNTKMVGGEGFEPSSSRSRTVRAAKLRQPPTLGTAFYDEPDEPGDSTGRSALARAAASTARTARRTRSARSRWRTKTLTTSATTIAPHTK